MQASLQCHLLPIISCCMFATPSAGSDFAVPDTLDMAALHRMTKSGLRPLPGLASLCSPPAPFCLPPTTPLPSPHPPKPLNWPNLASAGLSYLLVATARLDQQGPHVDPAPAGWMQMYVTSCLPQFWTDTRNMGRPKGHPGLHLKERERERSC